MDRSKRKVDERLKKILLIGLLACLFVVKPALGQSNQKAPIVVDGRELLTVSSYESISAADRAKQINRILQGIVESHDKPAEIEIKTLNNSPVIFVNDRYIMTVTQKDVDGEQTPQKQAQLWGQQID